MAHPLFTIPTATDSYKVTHARQYPDDTQIVYSHAMPRRMPADWDGAVWFGLQYDLIEYFAEPILPSHVDQAEQEWTEHFGREGFFNREGFDYIMDKHAGKLPVSIRALPEGTVVPARVVPFDIINTDPNCAWLTNWLETMLSHVWYPTTVASQSRMMAKAMKTSLEITGTPETLPFKLHDFGFRGVTCFEQAAIGAAAHLLSFMGTDTFAGCRFARKYYGAEGMPGASIPASEHSTVTIHGEDGELSFFERMLDIYPEDQIVACVSDSYDIFRAIREYWGGALKDKILARKAPLVIRPDSSDKPVHQAVVEYLDVAKDVFGMTANSKGFGVLPDQVRLIQGDGIDYESYLQTLSAIQLAGYSVDNIAFGSGGGLLQKLDRDTIGWAIKCSYGKGETWEREVFKSPVGMSMKRSPRGLLKTVRAENEQGSSWATCKRDEHPELADQMREVYRDGEIIWLSTWDEVRARVQESI